MLKFFFVIFAQIPLPDCRPVPCSLALAHCWSESAPLKLLCSAWRVSVCLAWQAAAMDQAYSETFLRIRKVQNLYMPLPGRKQARFGHNTGKHYWVCCMFHKTSAKGSLTPFGKEMAGWFYVDIYPGGPGSGKHDLVYVVEKSQVPRQLYQCFHNSMSITPGIIYLLFLDLVFTVALETKRLEHNSTK